MIPYQLQRLQSFGETLFVKVSRRRCFGYSVTRGLVAGKHGLEFGGPSLIFSANHLVPIYNLARVVDNCDFANQTLWATNKKAGKFGCHSRSHFVAEAAEVSQLSSQSYDFVAASHVLEHVANPLRALVEWKRLLRPTGSILLVLPHKAGTFDRNRPFTTFEHIKADFDSNVTESDLTHLDEILALHDLTRDRRAGSLEQFRQRCERNYASRAMHHHVFSPEVLVKIFTFLDMKVVNVAVERPFHIIVHAQKDSGDQTSEVARQNAALVRSDAEWRKRDPFAAIQ